MNIDAFHLEDIENPEHPSDFIPGDGYTVLVLRLPEVMNSSVKIYSYAFVVEGETCYFYNRERQKLEKLGTLTDMNQFLDKLTEKLIKDIQKYHYEIELMEESLYENRLSGMFMQQWLSYKKDVSLIHRLMFHAALSFELFITHHKRYEHFEELAYADLYEHMVRIRDLAKAAMDKLDNLYDFYRAKVDEKMNRNVYYLTILSGIFLPLTLMTGFFGMNTGGLPWTDDPDGTTKVVLLSLVLELLFMIPFLVQNMKKIKKFQRKR
ncbi:MAG: magnesium transporter [Sulfurospirillum sp.]|nr:MAG: magnesium transporter [Sulfurospirillum sp.]